jgi:hypothetical protein
VLLRRRVVQLLRLRLILPCTRESLVLSDDFTDLPFPEGRLVAGFDVGRSQDRSELAVLEEVGGRFICRQKERGPSRRAEAEVGVRVIG